MPKVKLLNPDMTSHKGFKWEVGKTYTIEKPGTRLCSDQVFHGYHSAETAALFNRIHANIKSPVCYEIETSEIVSDDSLKFGVKSMTLTKKIELPVFSRSQRTIFAILCAKQVRHHLRQPITKWDEWAETYMNSTDAAAYDAYAYAADAADAAAYAADAADASDARNKWAGIEALFIKHFCQNVKQCAIT